MKRKVINAIEEVHSYAGQATDEWITIKKEVMRALPSEERSLFSTRDPITKKQVTNEFEYEVAAYWSKLTGREVVFS